MSIAEILWCYLNRRDTLIASDSTGNISPEKMNSHSIPHHKFTQGKMKTLPETTTIDKQPLMLAEMQEPDSTSPLSRIRKRNKTVWCVGTKLDACYAESDQEIIFKSNNWHEANSVYEKIVANNQKNCHALWHG
jgi:hypothetical protein